MLVIGYILILLGFIAIFSGIVGLFRFPDFYTKIHACSVIDCCGVPLCLTGLAFLQSNFTSFFKLIFAGILILILSPVSAHALGRAALLTKTKIYNQQNK